MKNNTIKVFVSFCEKIYYNQSNKVLAATFISVACFFYNPTVAQTTINWIGSGTATGGNTEIEQNFNNPLNWDLLRVPSATDDVNISFSTSGTVNFSINTTIKNLTVINNKNKTGIINVGVFTLTVNGTTSIDLQNNNPNNNIFIGVNDATSAGTIDFVGDVVIGNSNYKDGVYFIGNANSTIICRSNIKLGIKARVLPGLEPGTLLFDGTGTQNFIFNNSGSCRFNNIVIGKNNNPTVVMGGTTSPDNILGNLTISGNAVLDLNNRQLNRHLNGGNFFLKSNATLKVAGLSSATNNGSASLITGSNFPSGFSNIVLDSTSTVEFYGTTQAIPGAAQLIKGYGNLTLTNGTKTLSSSFAMFRNLILAANTTMALGNFNDTLKSNSQTTAYVAAVPTTAAFTYGTGGFVIERYLAAYKSWRLLATPIDTATSPTISAAWREGNSALTSTGYGTQITGPQGPTTASNTAVLDVYTQRGSLKSYNSAFNNYVEVTNANTTKIANTAGYYVYVRGDRAVGITGAAAATNLRIKGRLRIGNQTFALTINKFASIGNPFPSKIDFRTIYNSSISPSYYVWNPNPAGTVYKAGKYDVYINYGDGNYRIGGPSGTIGNYIESGQAIFVQSITGGIVTIKESDKLSGSSMISRGATTQRKGINNPTLQISLLTKDGNGEEIMADAVVINLDADYKNDIDNMDVRKILNTSDNLSIKKGSINLVLESRRTLNATDTINLELSSIRVGQYRFSINPSLLQYPTLQAFIKDKFLETETALSFENITDYAFTTTDDAASRATDRFMIVFKSVAPAIFTAIKAKRQDNNAVAVTWNMANENNINYYEIERSADGINYKVIDTQLPTANNMGNHYYTYTDGNAPTEMVWYRIKANAIAGAAQYSAKANAIAVDINTKHGISIYPNPVVNGDINLYFNNKAVGIYNVSVFDNAGNILKTIKADIQNNASIKKIKLTDATAGIYRVTVKDAQGNTVAVPFVIL